MEIRQGIDIVSVKRMGQAINRQGARFTSRIFTLQEKKYCESKRMKFEHYAARFAAKEAFMKTASLRKGNRFRFREIEVRRMATGKPFIYLSEKNRKRFGLPKQFQLELSMAHEREYAVATVILVIP